MTPWWRTRGAYSMVSGEVTACQMSMGAIGLGMRVRSLTVLPRSGMPAGGSTTLFHRLAANGDCVTGGAYPLYARAIVADSTGAVVEATETNNAAHWTCGYVG